MARPAALAVAALAGFLLAGCFGPAGLSLPQAGDGVQTVSDAADALDVHRSSASENAKAAIAITDALGSFVRDISADQRALSGRAGARSALRSMGQYVVERDGKRILSGSELILHGNGVGDYCQSSAGYSISGIPSLDATFGWQSGAMSGGKRAADARGMALWSAHASGAVVQGAIGSLSIERNGASASCPMNAPAFVLKGGTSENGFEIPIAMAFRRGELFNLSVASGRFASGDSLDVTTTTRRPVEVNGVIATGRTQLATFRTNAAGNGKLTITSTGAQYVVSDWIVAGT
jgi:outer membrane murein-binding lipoprotein Lpp